MRVVSISYNPKHDQPDPHRWLARLDFYTGMLEALAVHCEVISIDMISWEGELEQNGVRHIFLSNRSSFFRLNRVVKKLEPGIVLIQGFLFPAAVIHLGLIKSNQTKIILQHHAERPFAGIKRKLFSIAGRYVDRYFFATRSIADDWMINKLIRQGDKIVAIPEGSSVFVPGKTIHRSPDVFLWVGRLNANKDPLTVIEAFTQFAMQHPSAKLYMIFQSGDLLAQVSGLITASSAKQNIELVGKVERCAMQSWYEKAAFIICSSYYEGCNISVIEGMSCSCIPIVTAIPSFDLHTDNGKIGLQFSPGNVGQLLQCLEATRTMDIEKERSAIAAYYDAHLSFSAIGRKMYMEMKSLADR
jgi:glycosyltransferase involved in cell wall biosynthesis